MKNQTEVARSVLKNNFEIFAIISYPKAFLLNCDS